MPHGESWFSVILDAMGGFYAKLLHLIGDKAGLGLNDEGLSYIAHTDIDAVKGNAAIQHVVAWFFVLLFVGLLAWLGGRKLRDTKAALVPEDKFTFRTFIELFVESVWGIISPLFHDKASARKHLPFLGTCAFMILASNLLGLVPGFIPPTDSLNTTLAVSGLVLIRTQAYGLMANGWGHVTHLFGPVTPKKGSLVSWLAVPLMLLMFCIEAFSHFAVRPGSLALRLMANMTADHLVLDSLHGLVAWIAPIPIYLLGVLVCVVQTLVFVLLSAVYISMAVAPHHHDDDHH